MQIFWLARDFSWPVVLKVFPNIIQKSEVDVEIRGANLEVKKKTYLIVMNMLEASVPSSVFVGLIAVTSGFIHSQIIKVTQKACTFDSVIAMFGITNVLG